MASTITAIAMVALLAAIVLLWKLSRDKSDLGRRIAGLEKDNAILQSSLDAAQKASALSEEMHRRSVDEIRRMNEQYLAAANDRHRKDMETMKEQFRAAAAEISSANSKEFREQSAERISEILAPVKERFSELDRTMKESHESSVKYNSELSASIRLVMEQ